MASCVPRVFNENKGALIKGDKTSSNMALSDNKKKSTFEKPGVLLTLICGLKQQGCLKASCN